MKFVLLKKEIINLKKEIEILKENNNNNNNNNE